MIKFQSILLVFINYSVVQGVLLFAWLLIKKKQVLLSVFFLFLSYLLFIFLLEINKWYKNAPHLIWTNVPVWFSIAPLLYLHINQFIQKKKSTLAHLKNLLHFLPTLGIVVYIFPFYSLSGDEKITIYESFYSEKKFDFIQLIYLLQITFYSIAGSSRFKKKLRTIQAQTSNSILIQLNVTERIFFVLTAYIVVAIAVSIAMQIFVDAVLAYYALAFFTLACVIITSTIYFLNAATEEGKMMQQTISNSDEEAEQQTNKGKYANSPLSEDDINNILAQMDKTMNEKELFLNPDFKISELAKIIDLPVHHISQSLNQKRKKNFFEYVNEFRVNAVINQLQKKQNQSFTLAAIALNCGFKSQSSFYRIFKKITGKTPNTYFRQ